MAVREIENFDFLRGRRVAASGCSLEPRTSFSSASDAGCKTKPAKAEVLEMQNSKIKNTSFAD